MLCIIIIRGNFKNRVELVPREDPSERWGINVGQNGKVGVGGVLLYVLLSTQVNHYYACTRPCSYVYTINTMRN